MLLGLLDCTVGGAAKRRVVETKDNRRDAFMALLLKMGLA